MTFMVDGILLGSTYSCDYPKIISRWEGWRKEDCSAEKWENSSPQYPENTRVHMAERHNVENFLHCSYIWLPVEFLEGNRLQLTYQKELRLDEM